MKDRSLLNEILLYLEKEEHHVAVGRLRKNLIKRLHKEIGADPTELGRLCSTFIVLFDDPKSDCQPSRSWHLLADKIRAAMNKAKNFQKEVDPLATAALDVLQDPPKKTQEFPRPFEDKEGIDEKYEEFIKFSSNRKKEL